MPGLRTTACAAALASSLNGPTTKEEKVNRGLRLLFWCTVSSGSSLTGGGTTRASSLLLRLGPREMTYSTVRTTSERPRRERKISLWNLVESQSRANWLGTPRYTEPSSMRVMWVSLNQVLKLGLEMVSSSSTSAFSQSSLVVVMTGRTEVQL